MRTAKVVKLLPAKEITMKKPRKSAPEAHLNGNGQESLGTANPIPSDEPALLAKQKTVVTARKVAAQNREERTATAAGGVRFRRGETGLPLLRQRRSRAVVHQAPRRSLPRLFQTALRFRGTKREHNSNPQSSNG